jgi:flavin-dependent dehydrogenase
VDYHFKEKTIITTSLPRVDALIIGAGPAGATTALLLAKAGWSVIIIEKKSFPRRKVCGEFISATSLPLLKLLGISDFYLSNSGPEVRRIGIYAGSYMLTSTMPTATNAKAQWGRALGREHLDLVLLKQAAALGAVVWQPASVERVTRCDDGFVSMVKKNHQVYTLKAKLVIMATGSWERGLEPVTSRLHKGCDLLAFKAHFKQAALAIDLMPLLAFPGGYGGIVNTDHQRVTLSCCIQRNVLQKARLQQPGKAAGDVVLQHIMSHCLGVRKTLQSAVRDGAWLAAGPIQPGIRRHYDNGLFFVGNIAGEAHPIIAEGISMAMQSAWLLTNTLIKQQGNMANSNQLVQLGQVYSRAWHDCFAKRLHVAKLLSQLAMRPKVITLVLPLCARFPTIITYMAALSGKVNHIISTQ